MTTPPSQKWVQRYIDLAAHVAQWSKDPSTKVGAVIVGRDPREVAHGYNGFPPGISDTDERMADRPTKYALTQHAERNVLDNARFDLTGASMFSTMYPCVECAKSIVSKKIARLYCPPPPDPLPGEKTWRDTVEWSKVVLLEGGVQVFTCEPMEN